MMSETILVTGASGYIGRHVLEELSGHNCRILVSDPAFTDLDNRFEIVDHPIFNSGDSHLYEHLGSPDRCIHLAWKDGFNHNSSAHLDNLANHIHFIEALMNGGIKSISTMGTMHEVGYWEGAIDESTPTNPLSFYGIAKNALRETSMLMAEKYHVELKWLRAFYITGDDATNHSIFAKIIEKANAGEKVFPFTSGKNKYDFLDVHELARQIVAASLQDDENGIINCCSGHPVSLGDKVTEFIKDKGYDMRLEYGVFPDRPYDSPAIWGDSSRIEKIMKKELQLRD